MESVMSRDLVPWFIAVVRSGGLAEVEKNIIMVYFVTFLHAEVQRFELYSLNLYWV
jgi:hypothetical protein